MNHCYNHKCHTAKICSTHLPSSVVDVAALHYLDSSHPKLTRLSISLLIPALTPTTLNPADFKVLGFPFSISVPFNTEAKHFTSSCSEQAILCHSTRIQNVPNFIHKIGCPIHRPQLTPGQNHLAPAHETRCVTNG